MNVTAKTSKGVCHTAVSSRFSSLLTADSALCTSDTRPPVRSNASFTGLPQKANSLQFVRRKNSGLTYIPQKSSTLGDNSFVPMTGEETVTDIPGEPDWERVVIDEPCDPATETRCFSRVRVDLP